MYTPNYSHESDHFRPDGAYQLEARLSLAAPDLYVPGACAMSLGSTGGYNWARAICIRLVPSRRKWPGFEANLQ